MRRVLLALATSIAVPAGLAIAVPTGVASAANAAPTIVTCGKLTGSETAGTTLTGCNQKAITGGSGKTPATSSETAFTIKWKSGKTTKGTEKVTIVSSSTCPTAFPVEAKVVQTVTGGTAGKLKGGKATNKICANATSLKVELLPGTKYKV